MSKPSVKLSKKGDFKVSLTKAQLEDFLALVDRLDAYQDNSYMTPLQRLWNTVTMRLKDRFTTIPYEAQTITLKKEESIILNAYYAKQHQGNDLLAGVMMEVNKKLL